MELSKFYNVDECTNLKVVQNKLKSLKKDGKIEYSITDTILKIEDIDLEEKDILSLLNLFDKHDIFEEMDYYDDGNDFEDYYDDEEYDD